MTLRSTTRLLRTASALAAFALVGLPGASQAAPRDPSGVWLTEDGKARIRIEKCGAGGQRVCGYAVWLRTPLNEQGQPRIDFRNPDPKKQARPSLGHQVILGLRPNAEDKFEGKIYNAENGKQYDVTIWSEQTAELSVRGCMLGILCGSQTWHRVNDVAQGQLTGPTNGANGPRADAEFGGKSTASANAAPTTTGTAGQKPAKAGKATAQQASPGQSDESPED